MKRNLLAGISALTFAAAVSIAAPASSASLPGMAGHAWIPSDSGCFSSSWAVMTNTCSATKKLLVPAVVLSGGTYNVAVAVYGGASPNVACTAVGNDNNGTAGWLSARLSSSGPNPSYQTLYSTVYTPGGTLHFDCDVGQNASVNSVFWYQ